MSLASKVLSGSLLQLAMQLTNRLIGLISTLLLARLLVPEDFGLVAIVVMVIQFFETLADAGTHKYLIQKSHVLTADLNTAWSLDMLIKGCITLAMIPGAWQLANWYQLPELHMALLVATSTMLIRAAKNPGYSLLVKEIEYRSIFKLTLTQKIFSFSITLTWALWSPSYWALIAGEWVSAFVFTVGTYCIHRFRPRWSLSHLHEQWHFSQWSLLRGVLGFLRAHLDTLLVSRLFPPAELGGYHLQRDLAVTPALLVIMPVLEPLLSAMAKSKHDHELFAFRFRVAFLLLMITLLPITGIMWQFSEGITHVVLGAQWTTYHKLLKYFSLLFITYSVFALVVDSFVAQGLMRALFLFDLLSTAALAVALIALHELSLTNFALYRGLLGLVITVSIVIYFNGIRPIGLWRLTCLLIPVGLALALGHYAAQTIFIWETKHIVYQAILGSMLYAFTYGTALLTYYLIEQHFKSNEEIRSLYTFFGRITSFQWLRKS
ncbi:MAG: oligosaccharide flippase family protein [Gammaproteobacteria bacterium]